MHFLSHPEKPKLAHPQCAAIEARRKVEEEELERTLTVVAQQQVAEGALEAADLEALMPWVEWAHAEVKAA